jgi:hypothetical protein
MPITLLRPFSGVCAPREQLGFESYLTDGWRLFRVVSQLNTTQRQPFASLEDCLTLEVQPYTPGELGAMNLRPVDATVDQ